jgi:hypothetical protein
LRFDVLDIIDDRSEVSFRDADNAVTHVLWNHAVEDPEGRAVIGGLIFATVSTLLFVPTFFSVLHGLRRKANPIQKSQ